MTGVVPPDSNSGMESDRKMTNSKPAQATWKDPIMSKQIKCPKQYELYIETLYLMTTVLQIQKVELSDLAKAIQLIKKEMRLKLNGASAHNQYNL